MTYENNIAIHPGSKPNFYKLMEWFESIGVKWADGEFPTRKDIYDKYEDATCVNLDTKNKLMFGPMKYYIEHSYNMVTFDQYGRMNPEMMVKFNSTITKKLINILNKRI